MAAFTLVELPFDGLGAVSIRRCAFTLVELLVVLAIITILIAILIPVIIAVREQGKVAACLSNLRQIGHGISMYGVDHKGLIIPADLRDPNFDNVNGRWGNWATILVRGKYVSAPDQSNPAVPPAQSSVFRCPDGLDDDGVFNGAYFSERDSQLQAGYWRRQAMNLNPDGSMTPSITIFTWYGINADRVGEDYPFFRYPSDTKREKLHSFSEIHSPSELAMVYDGFFEHGGGGAADGECAAQGEDGDELSFCGWACGECSHEYAAGEFQ